MLQPIERHQPQNADEIVAQLLSHDDSIARCAETGAHLDKSRGQYVLVVPNGEHSIYRHWSRRKVQTDQDAIEKANKSLQRILNERDSQQAITE